jgi:hypothetical protein
MIPDPSRWQAVVIEGNALIQWAIATAKQLNSTRGSNPPIVYSLANLISQMPTSPWDIIQLRAAPNFNLYSPAFPTRLSIWFRLGYNGNNPLILVTNGGMPAYSPDVNGQPKQSGWGLDPNFLAALEETWRAAVFLWAVNGGYLSIDFSQVALGVPTEWGSIFYFPTQTLPDDSTQRALPWLANNSDYGNLRAALAGGKITQQQLYNAFQMGVVFDQSLAIPLGLVEGTAGGMNTVANADPDFSAAFYANDNNKVMLEAWLALPVPAPQPVPPSDITTTGFGPPLVPVTGSAGWPAPTPPLPGTLAPPPDASD